MKRDKVANMDGAFIDLEKVYDKNCRELWRVLHEFGFDGYLTRSMSSSYEGCRACVRLGSKVGEYF